MRIFVYVVALLLPFTVRAEFACESMLGEWPVVLPAKSRVQTFRFAEPLAATPHEAIRNYYAPLRAEILRHPDQDKVVRSVLYLAAGADLGFSHQVFPNARLHVTVDDQRGFPDDYFDRAQSPEELFGTPLISFPYARVQGDFPEFTGPRVLGSLRAGLSEGSRILALHVLSVYEHSAASAQDVTRRQPPILGTHLLVEIDTGPGSLKKFHLHLNTIWGGSLIMPHQWWFKELDRIEPEALLIKAGMGVISGDFHDGESVMRWLRTHGGIAIADTQIRDWRHPGDEETQIEPGRPGGAIVGFGYQERATVVRFRRDVTGRL